jgi:type IX secretion system PorP/SprF family membrane protein
VKQKLYFLCWILVVLNSLPAQDVQFSQFYATNLSLNPAFTGATRFARVTAAQRLQWPNAQGSVTSSLLAYDRFFYYQKIGLGGLFQYDRLASGALNNFQVGPTASYLIYNQKKKYLRMGLGLNFVNKRYATSALVFGDQLDPDFGKTIAQSQDPNSTNPMVTCRQTW